MIIRFLEIRILIDFHQRMGQVYIRLHIFLTSNKEYEHYFRQRKLKAKCNDNGEMQSFLKFYTILWETEKFLNADADDVENIS